MALLSIYGQWFYNKHSKGVQTRLMEVKEMQDLWVTLVVKTASQLEVKQVRYGHYTVWHRNRHSFINIYHD